MSTPNRGVLRVWAPMAREVDLVTGGRRIAMDRESGDVEPGGWTAPLAAVAEDGRYAFSVDGGSPAADPRSGHQPDGVNGPSALVDHGAFAWTDGDWRGRPLAEAIIYELHVGAFTPAGTFDGVVGKIPHLAALGITAVELMPVAEFPGVRGWGYDGVFPYAPHHSYGGPSGLKRLVDACHAAGIAVVMDVVYNHLGPYGNVLPRFGPYFTDRYRTPWGDALNFDGPWSDEVRAFVLDNAEMWLRDYHVDGLRLDATQTIYDTSAVHLLEELAARVEALAGHLHRDLWVIAESDLNDPRLVTAREAGGYGLDAAWADDFHHAVHAALTGERQGYFADFGRLEDIGLALTRGFARPGEYSTFRRRRFGREARGIHGSAFVAAIQNHDQVGNRALGERLSSLVSPGLARVAAALLLTSPFTPLLFAGEEWGAATPFLYFTDHSDPGLAAAVSRGRRGEFAAFGWAPADIPDPQDPATMARSCLDWAEVEGPRSDHVLGWYRGLIRLRQKHPALGAGPLTTVQAAADEDAGTLTISRWPGSGPKYTVACNVSLEGREVRVPVESRILLASDGTITISGDVARLPAHSVVIVAGER